jgi:hypothetical protein
MQIYIYKKDKKGYRIGDRSAMWYSQDDRWRFFLAMDLDGWFIRGNGGESEHPDNQWLKSIGLYHTPFKTRREAISTLEEAMKGNS